MIDVCVYVCVWCVCGCVFGRWAWWVWVRVRLAMVWVDVYVWVCMSLVCMHEATAFRAPPPPHDPLRLFLHTRNKQR